MLKYFFLFSVLCLIISCKSNKNLVIPIEPSMEYVELDTLTVTGEDPKLNDVKYPYRSSATRYFDLLHTRIYLSFDWLKQQAIGKVDIELTPLAKPQEKLVLDAKSMEIKSVVLTEKKISLDYTYDKNQISITLDKKYNKGEILWVSIEYIAKPNDGVEKSSDAILSDKGLFFINPLNNDKDKPQQIWTQGETENNSKWFPTFDKPNERCSQEIFITVEEKFSTLSNGKLISSTKNNNGTRTDYWKQEKPHAPYLFMMAIGEYAWVEEKWKEIPVYYLVEKPYAPYAKQIFNHTPEMLSFFENKFKYKYPWDKYAQVITRDYVSGAMENTTAVVFGEFIQKTDRELIDNDNDAIVAHEMAHHWFGDLVTCESWSNLTLNEGFANYAEYLWKEHKYGLTNADEHRLNELFGYLSSSMNGELHPLIHFHYPDKESMFDAHSYNKGGLVLHHLRSYLGDEIFFNGLARYLKENEYTAVEADELRLAFEDESGEDLNWFFNQWYFREGHPVLNVDYKYDEVKKQLTIQSTQDSVNVFRLPLSIAIYDSLKSVSYHSIWVENFRDTFTIEAKQKPYVISFDGKDVLPGIVYENKSEEQWINTFRVSNRFMDKFKAFQNINVESNNINKLVELAINDDYYYFRNMALQYLAEMQNVQQYKESIIDKCLNDAHSQVRQSAIALLNLIEYDKKAELLDKILSKEKAYNVIGVALSKLNEIDPMKGLEYAKLYSAENNGSLDINIASVFSTQKDAKYDEWYAKKVGKHDINFLFELCGFYNIYLLNQSEQQISKAIDLYSSLAKDQSVNRYRRFICTASLVSLKNLLMSHQTNQGINTNLITKKIEEAIHDIKLIERDEELITRYSEF